MNNFKTFIGIYVLSVVAFVLNLYVIHPSIEQVESRRDVEDFNVTLYRTLSPSVVQIYHTQAKHNSTGSGVYIADNILVTNYHVIEPSLAAGTEIEVVTTEGTFTGEIIEHVKELDLALVRTKDYKGVASTLGDSSTLTVGTPAISIGASYGIYSVFGSGYITGLNHKIWFTPTVAALIVSTGIVPGNSGGAVYNTKGHLIGISYAGMRGSDNIGFAIPINLVKETFKEYLR